MIQKRQLSLVWKVSLFLHWTTFLFLINLYILSWDYCSDKLDHPTAERWHLPVTRRNLKKSEPLYFPLGSHKFTTWDYTFLPVYSAFSSKWEDCVSPKLCFFTYPFTVWADAVSSAWSTDDWQETKGFHNFLPIAISEATSLVSSLPRQGMPVSLQHVHLHQCQ